MDDDLIDNQLFIGLRLGFQATRVVGQRISPTKIKFKLDFSTSDEDSEENAARMEIALAKIEHWVTRVLNNSIIIDANNIWAMDSFMGHTRPLTTNDVVLLPEDPTDAILCEALFCKFKTLVNGALHLHGIEIESTDARGMSFLFIGSNPGESFPSAEEWLGSDNYFSKPWWFRDDASSLDVTPDDGEDLSSPPRWAYSLGFIADEMTEGTENPNVVVRPEFRPKVIEGGKVD